MHHGLYRTTEFPAIVGRKIVVWRDEYGDVIFLGRLEQLGYVINRIVGGHAFADYSPGHALRTQKIVLWIRQNQGGAPFQNAHTGVG